MSKFLKTISIIATTLLISNSVADAALSSPIEEEYEYVCTQSIPPNCTKFPKPSMNNGVSEPVGTLSGLVALSIFIAKRKRK